MDETIRELKSCLKIVEKQRDELSKRNADLSEELKLYRKYFRLQEYLRKKEGKK